MFTVEHAPPGGMRYCKHICVAKVSVFIQATVNVLSSTYAHVVKEQTRENIFTYIKSNRVATVQELALFFDLSRQTIHRHIRILMQYARITKIGRAPIVCYVVANCKQSHIARTSRGKMMKYKFFTNN